MKRESLPISIFTLVFILFSNTAFAQGDYAIRINGDTIKGSLKILDYELVDRVQIKSEKEKTTLTAMQVRSLTKNNEHYRPVMYDNTVRFMKVLVDGYLSLLVFHLSKQTSLWDGRYLAKLDGTGIEVPNLGFKKTLSKYLADCGDIKDRVEKGEFGRKDLEKIINIYNACMQDKTADTFTKSPLPSGKEDERVLAVKSLIAKVEAENLTGKKDAVDILNDIQTKVIKNEAVPNYLLESLKASLAQAPSLTQDLEALLSLLKK